jgi:hypothetical protein
MLLGSDCLEIRKIGQIDDMALFDVVRYTLKYTLTFVSTIVNLVLVLATVRSKLALSHKSIIQYNRKLRSSCNILLAVDGCSVLLMQTERVVHLVIAAVWQTVLMRNCYFALFLPSFGLECSFMFQLVIAFDRFIHILFPFWWSLQIGLTGYRTIGSGQTDSSHINAQ